MIFELLSTKLIIIILLRHLFHDICCYRQNICYMEDKQRETCLIISNVEHPPNSTIHVPLFMKFRNYLVTISS